MRKFTRSKSIVIQKPINNPQKKVRRVKKDNKKIARTRRQRGYNWENTIVKRFNGLKDWKAFRLGSPSVALPDVLVVSTKNNTIFKKNV